MRPEPDGPVDTPGEAPPEEVEDAAVMSEQRAGEDVGAATPSPAAAAAQRGTERLVLAEVACMVVTAAGVFLGFVPLVLVGFILSVVAVVVV